MASQNFRIKNGLEIGVGNTYIERSVPQRVAISTAGTTTIDTVDGSKFRTASYTVQARTQNQIVTSSIGTTQFGSEYVPGTYSNVQLFAQTGVGTGAKATIGIVTEGTIEIGKSIGSIFTSTTDISSLSSGDVVVSNRILKASSAENSKAIFELSNVGSGYTVIPEVSVTSPTISNNTVTGVEIGSPAIVNVSSVKLSNVVISGGSTITSIPTAAIPAPDGGGVTAEGVLSFGLGIGTYPVSTSGPVGGRRGNYVIGVACTLGSGVAIGYSARLTGLLQHNFPTDPTQAVGVDTLAYSTFSNLIPRVGSGYTPADFPVSITAVNNNPTGTAASFTHDSFCLPSTRDGFRYVNYEISNVGTGYTEVPTLVVDNPAIGSNVGLITGTLGISTITLVNGGSGYRKPPEIIGISTLLVGYAVTVGMGISNTGIYIAAGSGYNVGVTTLTVTGINNVGSSASMTVTGYNSNGGIEVVSITNTGVGYTAPPIVTIENSNGISTGASIVLTELFVNDIAISTPRFSGYGLTSATANDLTFSYPERGSNVATINNDYGLTYISIARKPDGLAGVGSGYLSIPGITITGGGGSGAAATITSLGISSECITITDQGSGYTNPPDQITLTPGSSGALLNIYNQYTYDTINITSPGSGYTSREINITPTYNAAWYKAAGAPGIATAIDIIPDGVHLDVVGSGYTAGDLPLTPTYGSPSPGGTSKVYVGIESFSSNPGLGYTSAPTVTVSSPELGTGTTATFISSTSYYSGAEYSVKSGPGYGGTHVYYLQKLDSYQFKLSTDKDGNDPIVVGIDTSMPVKISIGGTATSITITEPGTSFQVGDVVGISTLSTLSEYSESIGTGISFTVTNVYDSYQSSEVILLHSIGAASSEAYAVEYSGIDNEIGIGTFSADLSGNDVTLKFTSDYNDIDLIYIKNHLTEF